MIAPILLCHICPSWRTIALGSATLWAHLGYCFTIVGEDNNTSNASQTYEFVERDIEFIRWWKKNQGSVAPFLDFDVRKCLPDDGDRKVTGDGISFLFGYLTSARYLKLHVFFWNRIHERIKAGHQVVFPNLQTLQMEMRLLVLDSSYSFYQVQALLPAHTLSTLRHLHISHDILPPHFVNAWVTLTHIELWIVTISLNSWFSFIRAVPNLQWGFFKLILFSIDYSTPPQCALLQLTTLTMDMRGNLPDPDDGLQFPLNFMFINLYLPALHTFTLYSEGMKSWNDHHAIIELGDVLKSTPAITKLALQKNFLSLSTRDTKDVLARLESVQPIWSHATQLAHLQLDLPSNIPASKDDPITEIVLDLFVRNICSSNSRWLDLQNPACPIQTITIRNSIESDHWIKRITDLTTSIIRKNAKNAPRVDFQIITESAWKVVREVENEWLSLI